jgi:hypothetical protein
MSRSILSRVKSRFIATVSGASVALLTLAASSAGVANAQVDCGAIPAGPARTDCFIGLSRINQQNSEIAATTARQQTDRATYRQLTGSRRAKTQRHPAASGR